MLTDVDLRAGSLRLREGADALVIVTEWDAFRALDLGRVQGAPEEPRSSSTCATSTGPRTCGSAASHYVGVGRG